MENPNQNPKQKWMMTGVTPMTQETPISAPCSHPVHGTWPATWRIAGMGDSGLAQFRGFDRLRIEFVCAKKKRFALHNKTDFIGLLRLLGPSLLLNIAKVVFFFCLDLLLQLRCLAGLENSRTMVGATVFSRCHIPP